MRVIKEFKCLHTGKYFPVGTEYPETDPIRVNELHERGFLEGSIVILDGFPDPDNGFQDPDNGSFEPEPERGEDDAGGGKAGAARQRRGV